MKTYENLDSSAIHSLKLDESQVKVVYKSNIAKEYTFSCENVTQFDEKLAYIISELEMNHKMSLSDNICLNVLKMVV